MYLCVTYAALHSPQCNAVVAIIMQIYTSTIILIQFLMIFNARVGAEMTNDRNADRGINRNAERL